MKKITIQSESKKLSFIVSNNDYKDLDKGFCSIRECLSESQQKKLDKALTAWECSHVLIIDVKEWSWTIDEMLDDIEENGGYDNFDHSSSFSIYNEWIKEKYPCTKFNGMRVAEMCADGRLAMR